MKNKKQVPLTVLEGFSDKKLIEEELSKPLVPLKFPPQLEDIFLEYHFRSTLTLIKFSFVIGLFLYIAFGALDLMLYPEVVKSLWLIRYGIATPVIIIALTIFNFAKRDWHVQLTYSIAIFLAGLSIIVMILFVSQDTTQKYYAGVMLVMFYGYVASGMRFWYAALAGWAITLSYILVSLLFIKPDSPFIVSNLFFLVSSNLVGMIGNFLFEESLRRDFLLSSLLTLEGKELEKLSNTDPLTGLANRRYFEEFMEREWKHAMRYKYPISLLMIDIDYFKNYNDHLGHQAGDRCLSQLASVLKEFERRPGDLGARYGGEEFVVILSGTDLEDALDIAEEIREKVMGLKIVHPASDVSDVVTVSIGVAEMIPGKGNRKEELVEAADRAMYGAKASGRNCVRKFPL